jgi:N-acetylmuramidase-like protein/putative peptidoglycan binding protein
MAVQFVSAGLPFTGQSVQQAADLLGVDRETILAITEVETAGCGFLADRRPQILFERHIFHRLTGGRFDAVCPDISASAPGGYGRCGAHQYRRLESAMQLDREAALRSTSWGLGQTMGFNAQLVGYPSAAEMVEAFAAGEEAQLIAIARFCKKRGLDDELRSRDWTAFAHAYNGRNFTANNYDGKLCAAYRRLQKGKGLDLRVRTAQVHMMYLGLYSARIDGVNGPATSRALASLQMRCGLPATGCFDDPTRATLDEQYAALIRAPEECLGRH